MAFIEFTDGDGRKVLINSDHVATVRDGVVGICASIIMQGADIKINVRESFEEIKKRMGMVITPRAETIALK